MTKRQTPSEASLPRLHTEDGTFVPASASLRQDEKPRLRTPRPLQDKSENQVLFRVELALSRLENGDYGYCVRCDQPISISTLEEDPSAVICTSCARPDA